MNDKLQLHEIVGYLPYGLKVQYSGIVNLKELSVHKKTEPKGNFNYLLNTVYADWFSKKPKEVIGNRISEIKEIKFYKNHIRIYVGRYHNYLKLVFLNEIKPILRPLSDLTKEIEVNGEKFVPLDILDKRNNIGLIEILEDSDLINTLPYFCIEFLNKWHFDVHNLIHRGLAIDINTLNNDR